MAKAKSKSVRLKGAVLIMVLTVMVVLIIMLTGAMALVSTASSRAYTKYEETQAYYTARSGLEVVTQTLMGDTVHLDKGTNNDGNNLKSSNTFSDTDKSQALALEEAFTGVLTTDPADPTKTIYDVSKSLTCWDVINNPDGTGLSPTEKKNSYMIFNVSDLSGFDDGESGIFSDAGDGSVQVKMQLLDLVFDDGVTTDPVTGNLVGVHRNDVVGNKLDVSAGDADYYYIMKLAMLVECTATYNGTSSTVSRVIMPINRIKQSSDGFETPGSLQLKNNSQVLGAATAGDQFSWGNNGISVGNVYANTATQIAVEKDFNLMPGENVIINGDFTVAHKFYVSTMGKETGNTSRPFVLVNGTLTQASNAPEIGETYKVGGKESDKVDLIVKNLECPMNDMLYVNGDTYIDGYLQLFDQGHTYNASRPLFGGNLFISDRAVIDATMMAAGEVKTKFDTSTGVGTVDKSYIGGAVQYSRYDSSDPNYATNQFRIKYTIDRSSKLWQDIILNGGDGLCTGNIYYWYYEDDSAGAADWHKFYGCTMFQALKEYIDSIKNPASPDYNLVYIANQTAIDKFYDKLHPVIPVGNNDEDIAATNWIRHIIQLAHDSGTPEFVEGVEFKAAGMSGGLTGYKAYINDDPTFELKISLPDVSPTAVNHRTKFEDARVLPTMLSKFAKYLFINSENPIDGGRWNSNVDDNVFLNPDTFQEIVNIKYKNSLFTGTPDATNNYGKGTVDTVNWREEMGQIAYDFQELLNPYYSGTATHDRLVDHAMDIMNALYEAQYDPTDYNLSDGQNINYSRKSNIYFKPAGLMAYVDNGIIFNTVNTMGNTHMDLNHVSNLNEAANLPKTIQNLSPAEASNREVIVDTSANDVILMLQPGTYHNSKIIVTGSNYCYIMMPNTTGAPGTGDNFCKYTLWNTLIVTDQYNTECLSASTVQVGANNGTSIPNGTPKIDTPNIFVYADPGVMFNFYNGGGTFMGYIYGPGAKIYSNKGYDAKQVYYNGVLANKVCMDILGSAFVTDIDVDNEFSFVYIPRTASKDPWEAKFSWQTGGVGYSNRGIKTEND